MRQSREWGDLESGGILAQERKRRTHQIKQGHADSKLKHNHLTRPNWFCCGSCVSIDPKNSSKYWSKKFKTTSRQRLIHFFAQRHGKQTNSKRLFIDAADSNNLRFKLEKGNYPASKWSKGQHNDEEACKESQSASPSQAAA